MAWKINIVPTEPIRITLGDFLDSIERNGVPQTMGTYIRMENGVVVEACAIGQASLNLGVEHSVLEYAINKQFRTKGKRGLASAIIGRNDGHHWKYKTIARYYKEKFHARLNEVIELNRTFTVSQVEG